MRISELIEELQYAQSLAEDLGIEGGDPEVRVAFQPSYPLRAHLHSATLGAEIEELGEDAEAAPFIWLVASAGVGYGENPYAPQAVFS
jgi:hypothetical protein